MDLTTLFDLFDKEEERRYQESKKHEPYTAKKSNNRYQKAYEDFNKLYKNHKFGETSPTGENLEAMKKYDISIEEAAVVYMYTSHGVYDEVNRQLRNNPAKLDQDIEEYSNLLTQALNKLPSYNNEIVYRDIDSPDPNKEVLLNFFDRNINTEITENAFMSSHIREGRWSDEENGLQLIILTNSNSNGKDLRELSFNAHETEVLFKKGTRFRVENVDRDKNKVELTEVSK